MYLHPEAVLQSLTVLGRPSSHDLECSTRTMPGVQPPPGGLGPEGSPILGVWCHSGG